MFKCVVFCCVVTVNVIRAVIRVYERSIRLAKMNRWRHAGHGYCLFFYVTTHFWNTRSLIGVLVYLGLGILWLWESMRFSRLSFRVFNVLLINSDRLLFGFSLFIHDAQEFSPHCLWDNVFSRVNVRCPPNYPSPSNTHTRVRSDGELMQCGVWLCGLRSICWSLSIPGISRRLSADCSASREAFALDFVF